MIIYYMLLGLPEISSALVLAPHPDDEALGCSGTLSLLNRAGVSTTIVFITNGDRLYGEPSTALAEQRKKEALRASELLGAEEPVFLGFPDGVVNSHIDELADRLAAIIPQKKPDIVFAPSPIDHHRDHIATSKAALKLLNTCHTFKLAFYEVYSTIRFSHLVDITEAAELKKQVIMNYSLSLSGKPEVYIHAALGLNAQRSIFTQTTGYYEAFYMVDNAPDLSKVYNYLCFKDY